jgi:hypothetical protein
MILSRSTELVQIKSVIVDKRITGQGATGQAEGGPLARATFGFGSDR